MPYNIIKFINNKKYELYNLKNYIKAIWYYIFLFITLNTAASNCYMFKANKEYSDFLLQRSNWRFELRYFEIRIGSKFGNQKYPLHIRCATYFQTYFLSVFDSKEFQRVWNVIPVFLKIYWKWFSFLSSKCHPKTYVNLNSLCPAQSNISESEMTLTIKFLSIFAFVERSIEMAGN